MARREVLRLKGLVPRSWAIACMAWMASRFAGLLGFMAHPELFGVDPFAVGFDECDQAFIRFLEWDAFSAQSCRRRD